MSNCAWCWESNPYNVYDWDWCEVCEEPACSADCLEKHMKDSHAEMEKAEPEAARSAGA